MFDRFVVVDWSANSAPKLGRDSIWVAVLDKDEAVSITNVATRAAAEGFLTTLFEGDPAVSTLVGVDFSLGYPAGTAAALGLAGDAWLAMWDLLADRVRDDDRNVNNRFAVAAGLNGQLTGTASPFWGCPVAASSTLLSTTKPRDRAVVGEWRHVEQVLRARGHRPFSSWQLLGAGAVGSQSLLGIPVIGRIRERFGDRVHVWPFTTGLTQPVVSGGAIVVVEIWPSLLPVESSPPMVRDAEQVAAVARRFADADVAGEFEAWFGPLLPPEMVSAVEREEGWVFGVSG